MEGVERGVYIDQIT